MSQLQIHWSICSLFLSVKKLEEVFDILKKNKQAKAAAAAAATSGDSGGAKQAGAAATADALPLPAQVGNISFRDGIGTL